MQTIVWVLGLVTLLVGWTVGVMQVLSRLDEWRRRSEDAMAELKTELLETKSLIEKDMLRFEARHDQDMLKLDARLGRIEGNQETLGARVEKIEKLLINGVSGKSRGA